MKKNKLITLTIVALLSLVTASVNNEATNATAQAKTNHATKKTHKKAAKKATKHTKNVKPTQTNPKQPASNNNQTNNIVDGYNTKTQKIVDVSTYTNTASEAAINKLNEFRQSLGLNQLTVDPGLTKIAQMRAQQTAENGYGNFGHYNAQGQRYCDLDAQTLNVMSYDTALHSLYENIAIYNTDTSDYAKALGVQSIQDEIDEGPTGSHYQNDTSTVVTKCGVGFYVNSNGNIGYTLNLQ